MDEFEWWEEEDTASTIETNSRKRPLDLYKEDQAKKTKQSTIHSETG
jgi:hypothetical protein